MPKATSDKMTFQKSGRNMKQNGKYNIKSHMFRKFQFPKGSKTVQQALNYRGNTVEIFFLNLICFATIYNE